MKIVQNCNEKPEPRKIADQLPVGTVYKVVGNSATYLRTNEGHLDILNNHQYKSNGALVDIIYPNARIVLE